jgi:hypothetical protein
MTVEPPISYIVTFDAGEGDQPWPPPQPTEAAALKRAEELATHLAGQPKHDGTVVKVWATDTDPVVGMRLLEPPIAVYRDGKRVTPEP